MSREVVRGIWVGRGVVFDLACVVFRGRLFFGCI